MKLTRFNLAAALALFAGGSLAWAAPRDGTYQSAGSGAWDELGTWVMYDSDTGWKQPTRDDGIPGQEDLVIISAGDLVTVIGDHQVKQLGIRRGDNEYPPGTLEITSGSRLTIRDGLGMARKPKDAESARIVFSGSEGPAGVLHSHTTLDIYGDIEVIGAAGGEIRTAKPTQLVCVGRHARLITSGGPLWVGGSVEMDGQVIASGPHTVTLDGRELREGSSGLWKLEDPKAKVRIATEKPVALVSGRITIEQGELDVDSDFAIGGVVTRKPGAVITVREGRSFEVRGRLDEPQPRRAERRTDR